MHQMCTKLPSHWEASTKFSTSYMKRKQMSLGWDSLPLLPLRCILDHLSMEDALAAMSTCRHWRSAFLLYEGKKHTLKLSTGHLQKNVFLTRIFRKHTRNLHIYIANERDLEKFINFILPQFFDTTKLKELIFIGPSYVQKSPRISTVALKRIIIESLIFKHSHCIEKLMFLGCEMGTAKNEHEKHTHKLIEHYSRALSFSKVHSPADAVLSRCNTNLMMFSSLKHILVNYEQLNTQSLETLSNLSNFTQLSFNIIYKRQMNLKPIDWLHLRDFYPNGLDVAVNIISLPHIKFNDVIENVLVERLQLTSLKVMFCKFLYSPILTHVVSLYQNTLREVVWADSPYDASASYQRFLSPVPLEVDMYNMNPFILLCWQCVNLRRLVIHGYWIWQYDLLGFVRLSKRLSDLQVSATYEKQNKFGMCDPLLEGGAVRVLVGDRPESMDLYYQGEVNKCIEFEWKQRPWSKLHPGLRERSTHQQRLDYIVYEASHPLGVT